MALNTGIHLYVDDERKMPPQFTHIVKTSKEAIEFLEANYQSGDLVTVSLDHDLGYDYVALTDEEAKKALSRGLAADTSRPVVEWMRDHNWWPAQLFIHSANPSGARWLLNFARDHAPSEDSDYYEIVNDRSYYQ